MVDGIQQLSVFSPDAAMQAVLDEYHARIFHERNSPRVDVPGGRDGGNDQRMRAIGPETGHLLNILIRSLKAPRILELGTSFGYSTLWLADAARATGGRVISMEVHGYKTDFARSMAEKAGLAEWIDFQVGDAVSLTAGLEGSLDFVFVDLWKDLYLPCLEVFYPKLARGALVVADNMARDGKLDELRAYRHAIRAAPGMRSLHLPVGDGLELSCFDG